MAYDEKTADRIRGLLSSRRGVVERKMMGGLCFMVNGHMCCAVSSQGGLLIRVGSEAHAAALREPHAGPMEMGGRRMTGFVRVASEGYRSEDMLEAWLARGLDFVETLPPRMKKR